MEIGDNSPSSPALVSADSESRASARLLDSQAVPTSGTLVRPKEAAIVLLAAGLWVGAICLFIHRCSWEVRVSG